MPDGHGGTEADVFVLVDGASLCVLETTWRRRQCVSVCPVCEGGASVYACASRCLAMPLCAALALSLTEAARRLELCGQQEAGGGHGGAGQGGGVVGGVEVSLC